MLIKIKKEKISNIFREYTQKFHFGEEEERFLILNYYELNFFLDSNDKVLEKEIEKIFSNQIIKKIYDFCNENIEKYLVFKDLVNKGFVVKSGLKYGSHFRVYFKRDYKNKEHSKYLVYILRSKENKNSEELMSLFRVAHSVKKRLLLAFVDEEGEIIYYETKWLRI